MLALLYLLLAVVALVVAIAALEYWTFRTPDIGAPRSGSAEARIEAIDRWLDALERQGKFNGTILFARRGSVVFQRNIGFAEASGRRIGDRTAFNLASVSKHMTAFAVLLLEREGELSRGDPLAAHLPELDRYRGVTLDHLLYHTSGIPEYIRLSRKKRGRHELLTPELLLSWLREAGADPRFPPGEKAAYCNTNYVLLAEIAARRSGLSFADFMEQRIFAPLGMVDTAVVNRIENVGRLKDRAYGFRKRFWYGGAAVPYDLNHLDGAAGDGNIYATARDLVTWDAALREGRLLPAELYAAAYAPRRAKDGAILGERHWGGEFHAGLGWNVQDLPVVSAYGAWRGFSNLYWRDLEKESVLVILSNAGFLLRTASIGGKLTKVLGDL